MCVYPALYIPPNLTLTNPAVSQDEVGYFKKMLFIPPRSTVQLQKELATAQQQGVEVRENMLAAKVQIVSTKYQVVWQLLRA